MHDEYAYRHVRLTGVYFECTRCLERLPTHEVGLRTMRDGTIRNQPRCRECRKYPPLVRGEEERNPNRPALKITLGDVTLINAYYSNRPVVLYLDKDGNIRNRVKFRGKDARR